MADEQNRSLKSLHDLVATCNDAAEGYGKAAKGLHDRELSDKLAEISGERTRFAVDLESALSKLGGEVRNDLHEGGILHQGWVDLETRIRPKNQRDILEDCIRGDQGTLKHYQHAITQDLPQELRSVVGGQLAAVERDLQFLQTSLQRHHSQHA